MVQLAAQSLPLAIDDAWLRRAGPTTALHIFEHVVNLTMGDDVLSLVTPEIGNGPFNMVVPVGDFRQHVTSSNPLTIVPNALHIGDLVIDLSATTRWNPAPNWSQLRAKLEQLQTQIPVIRAVLQRHAPANSWAQLVVDLPDAPAAGLDAQLVKLAQRHWDNLCQTLVQHNPVDYLASVKQIVGLGHGLTPSGDDWLVGCGLAAQLDLPSPEIASRLLKTISLAAPNTTQLSSAWLKATTEGFCSEHWHRFFAACLLPDSDQVYATAWQIVEQGHTSGADALAGYLAIIEQ